MTDFYSQNRCVCSTRSHGPLLCAFCLSFHFKKIFVGTRQHAHGRMPYLNNNAEYVMSFPMWDRPTVSNTAPCSSMVCL